MPFVGARIYRSVKLRTLSKNVPPLNADCEPVRRNAVVSAARAPHTVPAPMRMGASIGG
jgi:hypothetical protein